MPRPCVRRRLSLPDAKVRVMFAENQEQAEDLLCQIREAGPAGDD